MVWLLVVSTTMQETNQTESGGPSLRVPRNRHNTYDNEIPSALLRTAGKTPFFVVSVVEHRMGTTDTLPQRLADPTRTAAGSARPRHRAAPARIDLQRP
jgi:hypothetical protein